MAILLAGPAHAGEGGRLGLEIKNGTGLAPGKYEQPFYDPRPVVTVQTDGPGDVTKDEARILPNRQVGPGACKLITGAPCVDFPPASKSREERDAKDVGDERASFADD